MPDGIQARAYRDRSALLSLAEQKPLWECGQCGHKNREDMAECGNCGKPSRTETAQEASGPSTPPVGKTASVVAAQTLDLPGLRNEKLGKRRHLPALQNPSGARRSNKHIGGLERAAQDLFERNRPRRPRRNSPTEPEPSSPTKGSTSRAS